MRIIIHVIITAIALWLATVFIHGINVHTHSTIDKIGTLLVVAIIFGIINMLLKPIIKTIGCAFYVLTLGLVAVVVNGLLLWLASWVAGQLKLPFHVTGFVAAVEGALIIAVVSWVLHLVIPDRWDGKR